MGQFKDGLDMSAIREVKYLRELRHQNVIEVSNFHSLLSTLTEFCSAPGRVLVENQPEPCP